MWDFRAGLGANWRCRIVNYRETGQPGFVSVFSQDQSRQAAGCQQAEVLPDDYNGETEEQR